MMDHKANDDLKAVVRTIPDYPKPGIMFRDITTLLLDGPGFAASIARMAASLTTPPDLIAGIEARGFIFGAALARELGVGLVLLRKQNKLPGRVTGVNYALEYGQDRIEMHCHRRHCPCRGATAARRRCRGDTGGLCHRSARSGRRPAAARGRHHPQQSDGVFWPLIRLMLVPANRAG